MLHVSVKITTRCVVWNCVLYSVINLDFLILGIDRTACRRLSFLMTYVVTAWAEHPGRKRSRKAYSRVQPARKENKCLSLLWSFHATFLLPVVNFITEALRTNDVNCLVPGIHNIQVPSVHFTYRDRVLLKIVFMDVTKQTSTHAFDIY